MPRPDRPGLRLPLVAEHGPALDRYEALLAEDQALRAAEYENPDPRRRRLRVSCNACQNPWCCNQRVDVELVEALVIYRWAAQHAPVALDAALRRGRELHERRRPLDLVDFFRRRVPCPFLVKGRCAIYPVRPYPCRTHYMAGNPLKCRDELQPSETSSIDPDPVILREIARIAEDVRFFSLIEEVGPTELAEVLHFIDRLAGVGPWSAPRRLDWKMIEG